MYESPRLQNKLSRTFIRTKVVVNIRDPLVTGFWVPRSHQDPFWVSVKYERLQHFCYDCGRIGHDSRSCKFQLEEADEEVTEQRFGSSLGTPHVKTIDEALMVLDKSWDETELVKNKPPAAAATVTGPSNRRKTIGAIPQHGNTHSQGDNSAIPLPRGTEWVNRPDFAEDTVMVANDSVPKITEIPLITAPMILIPQPAVPTVQQPLLTSHVMHDSEDIGVTNENDNDGVSLGIFGAANGQNLNEVNEALMVANQSEPNVMEIPQSAASMVQHPLLSPHFMQESDAMGVTNDNGNDRENLGVVDAADGQNFNEEIDIVSNNSESVIMAATHLMGPTNNSLHSNSDTSTVVYSTPSQAYNPTSMTHAIATSPESSALIMNQQYLVESPPSVPEMKAAGTPLAGLSPLSAVVSGLNRIQLKRHQDQLEMEMSPIPPKRRLLYLEPAQEAVNNTSIKSDTSGKKRVNFRKLKNSIRGKKDANKFRSSAANPSTPSIPHHASPMMNLVEDSLNNITPDLEYPSTADGCHQAAIGSP
ncbi:hypothetical protein K1719_031676 [Acacia pycnantha]|nr:hypothetical protein K1719_031676 [Acacia pycnantha]